MAMKGLIEAECGGANPLMKFANHFVPDGRQIPIPFTENRNQIVSFQSNITSKPIEEASGQELADEFVSSRNHMYKTAPSTFNMQNLLQEIQQNQPQQYQQQYQHQHQNQLQPHQHLQHHHPQHNLILPLDHEVMYHQQQNISNEAGAWADEFKQASREEVQWNDEFVQYRQDRFDSVFNTALSTTLPMYSELQLDTNVLEEERSHFPVQSEAIEVEEAQTADKWVDEYKEYEHEDVWSEMVQEWKNFTDNWKENEMWAEEFQSVDAYKEYKFEEENPLVMDGDEALSEGVKRMNEGDVANAVLFLETAVKQNPSNSMAWFYLGTSQADNEQEHLAIAAFNKCLELNPDNLKALLSLAVSYTNEGVPSRAYENLLKWISTNNKYKEFVQTKKTFEADNTTHAHVLELFLEAVKLDQNNIDPDLQTCLGIIFNLSADYNKAVDCFKTALQITPNDSMLWNKLGATLANGHMSEQSILAYRNALSLRPGYVRTRFNLGVACVNLGAYKESIEHFLSALKLQNESKAPISQLDNNTATSSSSEHLLSQAPSSSRLSSMSSNIWQSLRLSLSLYGKHDMVELCDDYKLTELLREFNV